MDFKHLVNTRYSVRSYSSQPVEEEKLMLVLEAACKAPSAVNYQPVKFYVIKSPGKLQEIFGCYHRTWFSTAPVVIVVTGLHSIAWKRGSDGKDHTDIDAAIAIDHLTLQAADLGLGTCWICNFDVEKTSKTLGLSSGEEPIALIPLGYPSDENIPVKKRKRLNEMVEWL
ncbi:MAG: nitroreductase family protein [Prolixibacteraceae bacterium]|nr:nitroreductase family protein [Prolixibacteraceae bacterium]